jgi:hypothetical protein
MNALFAVKDAMDKNVSYKALIAEKEHLDANIADALNKILIARRLLSGRRLIMSLPESPRCVTG